MNYFKTNHPNFWFLKQLKKNFTEEHGINVDSDSEEAWINVAKGDLIEFRFIKQLTYGFFTRSEHAI